jgi:hypothetical protein
VLEKKYGGTCTLLYWRGNTFRVIRVNDHAGDAPDALDV